MGKRAMARLTVGSLKSIILFFCLLSACCFLPACVMDALRDDVNRLQNENNILRAEVDKLKEKSVASTAGEDSFNAIRQSQAEVQTELSGITKDLQVLSGKFEENKDNTEKKLRDTGLEMDLLRAQMVSVENQLKESKNRVSTMEERFRAQREAPKEQPKQPEKKTEETAVKPPEPAKEQPAKQVVATGGSAKTRYDAALKLFREQKYKEARERLDEFVKAFPKDQLTENAYFWIAETYYREKDFEGAIVAYETLLKKFPSGQKGSGTLYKQALSFIQIGDNKSGKVILEQLVEKYPKSPEAEKAKSKLKELTKQPAKKPVVKKKKR